MPLIECPECKHMISEYADKCIYCGCPIEKIRELRTKNNPVKPIMEDVNEEIEPIFKNSYTYLRSNKEAQKNIDTLSHFILDNTNLEIADYSLRCGFRLKDARKFRVVFTLVDETVFVTFRSYKNHPEFNLELKDENLEIIKDKILEYFAKSKKKSSSIPRASNSNKISSFVTNLNKSEKLFISKFEAELREKIPNLLITDNVLAYTFKIVTEETVYSLCWFCKGDHDLMALKYYGNPIDRCELKEIILREKNLSEYLETILNIYNFYFKNQIGIKAKPETPKLFMDLLCLFKGMKIKSDKAYVDLCDDVKNFVDREVMYNAIHSGNFSSEENYKRYKTFKKFTHSIFGYVYDPISLKIKDIEMFYSFYEAVKVLGVVNKYKNIFKMEMVFDGVSFVKSLQSMIVSNKIEYSMCDGLTSNFKFIPYEALNEELEKYEEFKNF